MEEKRKIYVVGHDNGYANWMKGKLVADMKDADLVVFTGGEDVSPELFNEPKHPKAYNSLARDKEETLQFIRAKGLGKKCIGICRGSQFLCIQAGGQLVQHQSNKYSVHPIQTYDNKEFKITSTHHQAQVPYFLKPEQYKMIAWTKGLSDFHENGWQQEIELLEAMEAEIVYYPEIKALGIQGHPEWMDRKVYPESFEYLDNLLDKFMDNKL